MVRCGGVSPVASAPLTLTETGSLTDLLQVADVAKLRNKLMLVVLLQ